MSRKQELLAEANKRGISTRSQLLQDELTRRNPPPPPAPVSPAQMSGEGRSLSEKLASFGDESLLAASMGKPFEVGVKTSAGNLAGGIQQLYGQAIEDKALLSRLALENTERQAAFDEAARENWWGAQAGKFGMDVAPALLTGGSGVIPSLLARAGTSALTSAGASGLQYVPEGESRAQNMGISALVGGAIPFVGTGLGKTKDYLIDKATPYVQGETFQKMGQFLGDLQTGIFGKVKGQEKKVSSVEGQAWDRLRDMAKSAPVTKHRFDRSAFDQGISDEITRLKDIAKTSPGLEKESGAQIRQLQDLQKHKIESFDDVIRERQNFNKLYKMERKAGETTGSKAKEDAINFAKAKLMESADINLDKIGNTALRDAWAEANKLTELKNKTFNQVLSPSGKLQKSRYSHYKKNQGNLDYSKSDTIVDQYAPKTAKEGIGPLKQFSEMVGSEVEAADILRPVTFSNAIRNGKVEPSSFFSRYGKLSDDQKNFLFGGSEKSFLDNAAEAYKKNPSAFGDKAQGFGDKALQTIFGPKGMGAAIGTAAGSPLGPFGMAFGGLAGATLGDVFAPNLASGFLKTTGNEKFNKMLSQNLRKSLPLVIGANVGAKEEKKPYTISVTESERSRDARRKEERR